MTGVRRSSFQSFKVFLSNGFSSFRTCFKLIFFLLIFWEPVPACPPISAASLIYCRGSWRLPLSARSVFIGKRGTAGSDSSSRGRSRGTDANSIPLLAPNPSRAPGDVVCPSVRPANPIPPFPASVALFKGIFKANFFRLSCF